MIKGYLKHTASFVALFVLIGLLYLAANFAGNVFWSFIAKTYFS